LQTSPVHNGCIAILRQRALIEVMTFFVGVFIASTIFLFLCLNLVIGTDEARAEYFQQKNSHVRGGRK